MTVPHPTEDRGARFAISYTRPLGILMTALGMGPHVSGVHVDAGEIDVRMGWAFRARFPRASVRDLRRVRRPVLSRGVHGWAGRWLVNGSSGGVVRMSVRPAATATVCGVPVRLTSLAVSIEDADGFLAAFADQARSNP